MYLPAPFEETRRDVLHALVRRHPLGLLVTQQAGALEADALPFLLDTAGEGAGRLLAHVARANPVWRQARQDADVLVVFQGPQAYISPNWYPSKARTHREVPTWNYVTVQARGRLQVRDDPEWLRGLLARLTAVHEADQPVPWSLADAPADAIDRMLRAVVGLEIELTALQGKWKVSQNKPAVDRDGVAQGLGQRPGDAAAAMAAQVRSPGG